jgi:hypothetical protein
MSERLRNADGTFATVHGGKRDRLYRVWCSMKERCNNPHNKRYARYGGRGIAVCTEWAGSFGSFRDWALNHGYENGLTIDRIDNQNGYSPENCRWITKAMQNRNYSRNHMLTYLGETLCVTDWADRLGINRATILYRIKAGKTTEEALSKEDGRELRWKTTSRSCTV